MEFDCIQIHPEYFAVFLPMIKLMIKLRIHISIIICLFKRSRLTKLSSFIPFSRVRGTGRWQGKLRGCRLQLAPSKKVCLGKIEFGQYY